MSLYVYHIFLLLVLVNYELVEEVNKMLNVKENKYFCLLLCGTYSFPN